MADILRLWGDLVAILTPFAMMLVICIMGFRGKELPVFAFQWIVIFALALILREVNG